MKLLKVFIILLIGLVIATQSFAISLQGLEKVRVNSNTHVHISTNQVRIYAITLTPTASNGYAYIIQTNSARQDAPYTAAGTSYNPGAGYVAGRDAYVKADVYGATANSSYHFEYPDGINVDEQCLVSATNANVDVYYKIQ